MEDPELEKNKKEIICLSCGKKVLVDLISFGGGLVAVCPLCGRLALSE